MARKDWKYTGDMNLEHGGLFFKLPDGEPIDGIRNDYVDAVEVIDLSGAVGGPDCIHRIERGTIYMPRAKWQDALDCCGYRLHQSADGRDLIWDGHEHHEIDGDGLLLLVSAFQGYSGLSDTENNTATVQIGKLTAYDPDPVFEPDTFLRGNVKLTRYVEREWL